MKKIFFLSLAITAILAVFTATSFAGVVTGRIYKDDGTPFEGAEIKCAPGGWGTSSASGDYMLAPVPEGIVRITVFPPVSSGYAIASQVFNNPGEGTDFHLVKGFRVNGTVTISQGLFNNTAKIMVNSVNRGRFAEITVNFAEPYTTTGTYEMVLPAGTYSFELSEGNYIGMPKIAAVYGPITLGPIVGYDLNTAYDANPEVALISGNIYNPNNTPFTSSFEVGIFDSHALFDPQALCARDFFDLYSPWFAANAGAGGYGFFIPSTPFHRKSFFATYHARDTHHFLQSLTINDYDLSGVRRDFTYDSQGITITGVVSDDSEPLFLAKVFLIGPLGNTAAWATTDINGIYYLYNVPAGEYQLQAAYGRRTNPIPVSVGAQDLAVNLNFKPQGPGSISGKITDMSGLPLANIKVACSKKWDREYWEDISDAEGNYSFQNLPEGIILAVEAQPEVSSGYAYTERFIYLNPSENKSGFDLKLKQGHLVQGYVRDASIGYAGISRVSIFADGASQRDYGIGHPDSSGHYEMILPEGTYNINPDFHDESYIANSRIVNITAPANIDILGYPSQMTLPVSHVSGPVVNNGLSLTSHFEIAAFSAEMPIGTSINLDNINYLAYPVLEAELPADGGDYSLRLPPSAAGYDVLFAVAHSSPNSIQSVTVRNYLLTNSIPAYPATYDSEGGTIRGRVIYGGQPALMAAVLLKDADGKFAGLADSDYDGTYTFYNVLAGNYTVEAKTFEDVKSRAYQAAVVNGETTTVDVYPNRAPILASIGDKAVGENQTLNFEISATDPDNDTLTYSASNLPQGASFDPATRIFNWLPLSGQAGTYNNIAFTVSDGIDTDSEAITIVVRDTTPPPAPTIDPVRPPNNSGHTTIFGRRSLDTQTIVVSCPSPAYATRIIYPTPITWYCGINNLPKGSTTITAFARDSAGNTSVAATASVTVVNTLPWPYLLSSPTATARANQETTISMSVVDTDGRDDIVNAHIFVNNTFNTKNCFYGYYDKAANKLYLRNDANTAWLGGFSPGSANIIENSYCSLNCANTTVTNSNGNTIIINWRITFKPAFTGRKNIYLRCQDKVFSRGFFTRGWVQVDP